MRQVSCNDRSDRRILQAGRDGRSQRAAVPHDLYGRDLVLFRHAGGAAFGRRLNTANPRPSEGDGRPGIRYRNERGENKKRDKNEKMDQ